MATFRIERGSPLSAACAWRRLAHWEGHAAHVPLTAITVTTAPPARVGTTLVARTGLGGLGFDDVMRVVRWEPPGDATPATGRCRLEKCGRVVTGWAEIEVRPRPGGGCRVVWSGDVGVRHLPERLGPVTSRCARLLYGRILDGLLADR
ncbi:SRPBCC family protein [Streptomyces sp. NPDC048506]|uniref:SRPBCC family protein n=1 Tax=Streptomyces sp. NPDC048506 TaxID=3155028 RepID=UPI00342C3CE9